MSNLCAVSRDKEVEWEWRAAEFSDSTDVTEGFGWNEFEAVEEVLRGNSRESTGFDELSRIDELPAAPWNSQNRQKLLKTSDMHNQSRRFPK
jgi:hypothetical protein